MKVVYRKTIIDKLDEVIDAAPPGRKIDHIELTGEESAELISEVREHHFISPIMVSIVRPYRHPVAYRGVLIKLTEPNSDF